MLYRCGALGHGCNSVEMAKESRAIHIICSRNRFPEYQDRLAFMTFFICRIEISQHGLQGKEIITLGRTAILWPNDCQVVGGLFGF